MEKVFILFDGWIFDCKIDIKKEESGMRRIVSKIFTLVLILLATGCVAKNYGKVSSNVEVAGMFRSGTIPADYRYYYFGEERDPIAILGIHNKYTLQARFWTVVDLNEKRLEKWRAHFRDNVGWIDKGSKERLAFRGYSLRDPQGNEAGILYSRYDWTVLEFPEKNVITVYPPKPMLRDPLLSPAQ